jgi:hypothetical protein
LTAYLAGDVSACCIKKKFATAVATAGLLAGLFGSAFVPAARAAIGDAASVTVANKTFDEGTAGTTLGAATNPLGEASTALATTGATFDIVVKDGTDTALGAAQTLTFTASSGFLVSAVDAVCAAVGTPTTATATVTGFGTAGTGCVTVKSTSVSIKAQTGTITISHAFTGVIKTVYVWAIGDVTSVTLSIEDGRSGHIAADNSPIDNYMGINAKDATGNRITVAAAGTGYTLTTGTADLAAGTANAAGINNLGLTADVCAPNATSGSTVAAQVTHAATGVVSNSVTLTCTTAGVKVVGYELQNSSFAVVTSGPKQALTIWANIQDASGRAVGDGGANIDLLGTPKATGVNGSIYGLAIDAGDFRMSPIEVQDSGAARAGAGALTFATANDAAEYGQVSIGGYTPSANFFGKNALEITTGCADLSAAAGTCAGRVDVLTYTTIDPASGAAASGGSAASVNAAKRIGSFTLSAAAGKLVTITVERVSDGKVWTYYRKANASGVATFLIRKVGRFDVFASYGDDVTDTVRMRRR